MICVLTYNAPHRKTQDVLFGLVAKGYRDICVLATPFVERKTLYPIFKHRPHQCIPLSVTELCKNLSIELILTTLPETEIILSERKFNHILIAGAGLLPEGISKRFKIINSHPGYLPFVKGLDSLKWAIYQSLPVGVTSHFISAEADEGLLIEQAFVPLYFEDSFHSFAYRQYEMEVQLLINSIEMIKTKKEFPDLSDKSIAVRSRMSNHYELIMMERFNNLRLQAPSYRIIA